MPDTTTIYASASAVCVFAKNKNFPKIADIAAMRFLRPHDFNRLGLRIREDGGFVTKRVPVVGRCPDVQP